MFRALFTLAHAASTTLINPNLPCLSGSCSTGNSPLDIIGNFYKFALGISGFLAITVIVYGAIKYATSAGNTGNLSDAKEWIYSALLGILLLAGAYILLNTIGGSQLTILKLPTLTPITAPSTKPAGTGPGGKYTYALVQTVDVVSLPQVTDLSTCQNVCSTQPVDVLGQKPQCVKESDNFYHCEGTSLYATVCYNDQTVCQSKLSDLKSKNLSVKGLDCKTVTTNVCSGGTSGTTPSGGTIGWFSDYDSTVKSGITDAMLNSNPGELCPKYSSVDKSQFWLALVKSISKAESSWNTLAKTPEPSIGTDPVTHQPVESDGLLQLSYGDSQNYKNTAPACQQINYVADQGKPDNQKTIFNPQINLSCGMGIMNVLLGKDRNVVNRTSLGAYWSTVRSGQNSAVIGELKQEIPTCF